MEDIFQNFGLVGHHKTLFDIVAMLACAVFTVALFKRLNLSPVIAYLIVGIIIAPFMSNKESTKYLAEFGVVFLLFTIGLELTLDRLISMRKHVFGFGSLQVLVSGVILGSITYFFTGDFNISFVAGFVFALSSTAVILQVLTERGEETTQYGRLSLATLILQDLAFVPLLILIPLLAKEDSNIFSAITEAIIQAAITLAVIFIVGRRILAPIYRLIVLTKSQELFLVFTLLIVLGVSLVTELNGLSLALGAFVAGLLVAETEYRLQVEADLKPFKSLLMGLFFISVGMTINIDILSSFLFTIIYLTLAIIIVKGLIVFLLSRIFGFSLNCSVRAGFILSQVSEFGFVLFTLASVHGIFHEELSQILIATISLSLALTPLLASLADILIKRFLVRNPLHLKSNEIFTENLDLKEHIIVIGFDRVGRTICDLLKDAGKKFVILDDDPRSVHQGRKDSFPIFYGKLDELDNLKNLAVDRAKMVVIATDKTASACIIIKHLKEEFSALKIISRAKDRKAARLLRERGAWITIAEAFESSLMIGNFVLTSMGLSDNDVEKAIDNFRQKEHPDSQLKGVLYKSKDDVTLL